MANIKLQAQLLRVWQFVDGDLQEEPQVPKYPDLPNPEEGELFSAPSTASIASRAVP
jgi:hypothetical protein